MADQKMVKVKVYLRRAFGGPAYVLLEIPAEQVTYGQLG